MDSIKTTVYTLAVLAVTTGIIDVLNTSEKLSKYTKYITSLVVILIILAPFKNSFADFINTLEQSNKINNTTQEVNTQVKDALESAITYDLSNKMSIPNDVFFTEITITSTESDTLIETIEITLTNQEYNRYTGRIEYYLRSNYGCEIKVIQCFKE
jgi:hypothetical protein